MYCAFERNQSGEIVAECSRRKGQIDLMKCLELGYRRLVGGCYPLFSYDDDSLEQIVPKAAAGCASRYRGDVAVGGEENFIPSFVPDRDFERSSTSESGLCMGGWESVPTSTKHWRPLTSSNVVWLPVSITHAVSLSQPCW